MNRPVDFRDVINVLKIPHAFNVSNVHKKKKNILADNLAAEAAAYTASPARLMVMYFWTIMPTNNF